MRILLVFFFSFILLAALVQARPEDDGCTGSAGMD
jgi:hypothetical protein